MASYSLTTLTVLNLTSAGTPQKVTATSTLAVKAYFQADADNTGSVFVFGEGLSAADGIELTPGQIFELSVPQDTNDIDKIDLTTISWDGDTTGNDLRVSYIDS